MIVVLCEQKNMHCPAKSHRHLRGPWSRYGFDGEGDRKRLARQTNALGHTTQFVYNLYGHLVQHIDPLGRVSQYSRDAQGQLTESTPPQGKATKLERGADGVLSACPEHFFCVVSTPNFSTIRQLRRVFDGVGAFLVPHGAYFLCNPRPSRRFVLARGGHSGRC